MLLSDRNSTYRAGVFLGDSKVREAHIVYLKAVHELQATGQQITSLHIVRHLNRSTSALETIKGLEALGYIYDDTEDKANKAGKNWKLTELGSEIVKFIQG